MNTNRLEDLYTYIETHKTALVGALSRRFGVSEMTIRRDLRILEAQGLVVRNYGGVSLRTSQNKEQEFRQKKMSQWEVKTAIGKAALSQIYNGMTLFLDSGSTNYALAQAILDSALKDLLVITADMHIASLLWESPNCGLFILGGMLNKDVGNTLGNITLSNLETLHGDLAFMGTSSISKDLKLYTPSDEKVMFKQAMMKSADRRVLLSDRSKFDNKGLFYIDELCSFDLLITNALLSQEQSNLLKENQCKVIKV